MRLRITRTCPLLLAAGFGIAGTYGMGCSSGQETASARRNSASPTDGGCVVPPTDAGSTGADAGPGPGKDAGTDAGNDAGANAGNDAGADAGNDAGAGAGNDAGAGAGNDAGNDAGGSCAVCGDGTSPDEFGYCDDGSCEKTVTCTCADGSPSDAHGNCADTTNCIDTTECFCGDGTLSDEFGACDDGTSCSVPALGQGLGYAPGTDLAPERERMPVLGVPPAATGAEAPEPQWAIPNACNAAMSYTTGAAMIAAKGYPFGTPAACDTANFSCNSANTNAAAVATIQTTVTRCITAITQSVAQHRAFGLALTGIYNPSTGDDYTHEIDMKNWYQASGTDPQNIMIVATLNKNGVGEARDSRAGYEESTAAGLCLQAASDCGTPVWASSFSNGAAGFMRAVQLLGANSAPVANIVKYQGIAPNLSVSDSLQRCTGFGSTLPAAQRNVITNAATLFPFPFQYFILNDDYALQGGGWLQATIAAAPANTWVGSYSGTPFACGFLVASSPSRNHHTPTYQQIRYGTLPNGATLGAYGAGGCAVRGDGALYCGAGGVGTIHIVAGQRVKTTKIVLPCQGTISVTARQPPNGGNPYLQAVCTGRQPSSLTDPIATGGGATGYGW